MKKGLVRGFSQRLVAGMGLSAQAKNQLFLAFIPIPSVARNLVVESLPTVVVAAASYGASFPLLLGEGRVRAHQSGSAGNPDVPRRSLSISMARVILSSTISRYAGSIVSKDLKCSAVDRHGLF